MQDARLVADSDNSVVPIPSCRLIDRFFALLIDCIFLAILLWVATHVFGTAQLTTPDYTDPSPPGGLFNPGMTSGGYSFSLPNGTDYSVNWTITLPLLWQGLIAFLYFTLQEAFFGRTLGKKFMCLRIVSEIDENTHVNLTLKAAILRNLVRFIDAIGMYLVGWIVTLCSPRRQRLGDMVARTLVVNEEAVLSIRPLKKQRVLGLRITLALLLTFLLGSALFAYFGGSQLAVQNLLITQAENLNTQPPFEIISISHYTLGQASWGRDAQGEPTITYPISYTAIYQKSVYATTSQTNGISTNQTIGQLRTCQGSITLVWHWWPFDWEWSSFGQGCTFESD